MITIAITKIVMLPTYPKKQQKIFSPLHQKGSLTKFRHAAEQQPQISWIIQTLESYFKKTFVKKQVNKKCLKMEYMKEDSY